jgi:hypothetical protein
MPRTPSYRKRPARSQALVTLTDSVTKHRRDDWLGEHGTAESRERYHRLIAEWEMRGRRLPPVRFDAPPDDRAGVKLVIVAREFYRWARQSYDRGELRSFLIVIRLMRKYCERLPAVQFGPKKLRMLREEMIRGDATADPSQAARLAVNRAARKTPLSCGTVPGTNRRSDLKKKVCDCYTAASYYRSIQAACDRAFPLREPLAKGDDETTVQWQARLTPKQWARVDAWRKIHCWHPYQLRHNAATMLRKAFGLEAAQLTLGHASANITDAVYAERDRAKVIGIMREVG